jgi:MmyB-like transcription regulator ligand binding domain
MFSAVFDVGYGSDTSSAMGLPGSEVRRSVVKRVDHPVLGRVDIQCQVLHIPDTDQRLVVYVSPPGGPPLGELLAGDAGVVAR